MQRKRSANNIIVVCALMGALVPASALAQTAPGGPTAQPADPASIISLLPTSMATVLSADLSQIRGAQTDADMANAVQIFDQALGSDLSRAEANLQNDLSMTQSSSSANLSQVAAADQTLVNQLVALDMSVAALEPPAAMTGQ